MIWGWVNDKGFSFLGELYLKYELHTMFDIWSLSALQQELISSLKAHKFLRAPVSSSTLFLRCNWPTFCASGFWPASSSLAPGAASSLGCCSVWPSPYLNQDSKNINQVCIYLLKPAMLQAPLRCGVKISSIGVSNVAIFIWRQFQTPHKIICSDSKPLMLNSWDGAWSLCQLMCKSALKQKQKVEIWNVGCCVEGKTGQTLGSVPSLCTFHPAHSWYVTACGNATLITILNMQQSSSVR